MINEIFVNGIRIVDGIPSRSEIKTVDIRCHKCKQMKFLKVFRKSFLDTLYTCISCVKTGHNNPFYGRHHSNETKQKIGASTIDYNGENNPFYGRHHSNETINKLKNNPRCIHIGKDNPFYGKQHSDETINIIKQKNKEYRNNNPEKVLMSQLNRIGKTHADFINMLNEYLLPCSNSKSISTNHGIDFRTMKSYWIFFKMISKSDLAKLTQYKKLFSNPSYPEKRLYDLLSEQVGMKNIKHCYELSGYYYDICLFDKLLVEYDGYYWHKIRHSKNDMVKSQLAKEKGYLLYRVQEPESRETDMNAEVEHIKTLLNENSLLL